MLGVQVAAVPSEQQDPEVPVHERLTQDSVFPVPGSEPELEDALNSIMPTRSVEQGLHRLEKTDEFTVELIQSTDAEGKTTTKEVTRRKRGRCQHCGRKTAYFCKECTKQVRNGTKYWCCGPDAPGGRDCQIKHDTEYVFADNMDGEDF